MPHNPVKKSTSRFTLKPYRASPVRAKSKGILQVYKNYTTVTGKHIRDLHDSVIFDQAREFLSKFWSDQAANNEILIPKSTKFSTRIPEIYHYIWFRCHRFKLLHYLSILSIFKLINSDPEEHRDAVVVFHTDCMPGEITRISLKSRHFQCQGLKTV